MPSWTGDARGAGHVDPRRPAAAPDLGVVAAPSGGSPRSPRGHPFAFAAGGPQAASISPEPIALPPHQRNSPVGQVLDCDGKILLLGVDHDANTTLHLAELLAGVPYRSPKHITVLRDGEPTWIDYLEK